MARIRSIKPEMWLSPQVMNLSFGARLLFVGLITQSDDQGRGVADARRLKAAVFPGDDVTSAQVGEWLDAIAAEGLAILYEADGHGRLYWLPTWHLHQSINKPKPSNYPAPPGCVPDDDGSGPGGGMDESRGIGRKDLKDLKEGNSGTDASVPGLDVTAWTRWVEYRTQIRKPLKPASIPAAQHALAAYGSDQAAVVEQSIANGWQGLFELRRNGKTPAAAPKRERPPTPEEIARARAEAASANATVRGLVPNLRAMP